MYLLNLYNKYRVSFLKLLERVQSIKNIKFQYIYLKCFLFFVSLEVKSMKPLGVQIFAGRFLQQSEQSSYCYIVHKSAGVQFISVREYCLLGIV